jgi:hypothetical protein
MTKHDPKKTDKAREEDISAPRLTPQGRDNPKPSGEDATDPKSEGAERGQPDKAEG